MQILIFRMLRNNADASPMLIFRAWATCVQTGPFYFLLHANLRGEGRGFEDPLCHLNFGLDKATNPPILHIIPLHEKFLQLDWLRVVVFQLNLKYLHVEITNCLRVVV